MIGFIQGRLSNLVDNKIQCFPWPYWENEFSKAHRLGLCLMEWTLDIDRISENPFMTVHGQTRIKTLMKEYDVSIPSLTGDFLMQFPFYKSPDKFEQGKINYINVIEACGKLNVKYLVFPLVDQGRLENDHQEEVLINFCLDTAEILKKNNVVVVFESDYGPEKLKIFIEKLPADLYGINYDIGNSASLGFNPTEELNKYAHRIYNVHVKDRILGGTTVPLGTGNANFNAVFSSLKKYNYSGNYILQTARAQDGDHEGAIDRYRKLVLDLLKEN